MSTFRNQRWLLAAALGVLATSAGRAQDGGGNAKLSIDHIDMKPTKNGFYDATVGLVMNDAKLGKTGRVAFSIVIADVHDADEAIDKVHDQVKTMSEDLGSGYRDLHREP